MSEQNPPFSYSRRLAEVTSLFLKLGFTAFCGPAAHTALMHHEIVERRKWLTDQEFLDLLGATNLIPGPNSTEMAIHIGFLRAGWLGLIVGGACFILPAMFMVIIFAWAYVRFGSLPQVSVLLYGIKPVMIAVILQALWSLGKKAVKTPLLAFMGLAGLILYFLGVNEIALLFGGALFYMLAVNLQRLRRINLAGFYLPFLSGWSAWTPAVLSSTPYSLPLMFLTFLKIGAVLYGSGYVLLAFLRADFVVRFGWLTDQQLLDAIAVGQVTPGPLFTSATFVGYLLGGAPGALLATLGIFLPAFIFVALSNPLIPRIRHSSWVSGLLDGANVSALALMAAVTGQIGRASLVDPITILMMLATLFLLVRFKINSTWLIAAGAAVGLILTLVR